MNRLKDQVAIVTGASRGIGRSIAEVFADEGANIVVNYTSNEKKASEVAKEIERKGRQAVCVKADVSNPADVKRLVNATLEKFGRIDILVNNAGVMFPEDFLTAKDEVWDKTMDINLKGAYLCSKEVAPIMMKQKRGKIINISSNSGLYHPSAMRYVEYVTSKAGMNGMTKAMAFRLGPYVTVNAICPGYIKTEMVAHNDPATEKAVIDETALKRFGRPDEVASAAVYLASNEADFVTGELLIVAGGRGMH
ncbi:MAG TPA: 3-oxoacyl-ACP reductase family protein [Terriglobales bacterium]|nr:3-oxoacyl-ACP reductase family protein [Terriglobales bacterium]